MTRTNWCGQVIAPKLTIERAACRQRAEEVYRMRNPGEVYRSDTYATSTRDAPFAGSGVSGVTSDGLASQYTLRKLEDDCLRSVAGNIGSSNAAPPADAMPPP